MRYCVIGILLGGCYSADFSAGNSLQVCGSTSDCSVSEDCLEGYCVAAVGAPLVDVGGLDADDFGSDAGVTDVGERDEGPQQAADAGDMVVADSGQMDTDAGEIIDGGGRFNLGGSQNSAGASCKLIHEQHPELASGIFWVDPDEGDHGNAVQVYCDMATDGGGWMLLANRMPFSDDLGMSDLDLGAGNYNQRDENFNLDVRPFYPAATQVVFAAAFGGTRCNDSPITCYSEALRVTLDPDPDKTYSSVCDQASVARNSVKLLGTNSSSSQSAYLCRDSLGWGNCGGQICHYGSHGHDSAGDGNWSQNSTAELHVPSRHSSYDDHPWCRSCYGGRQSICCHQNESGQSPVFTIWLR